MAPPISVENADPLTMIATDIVLLKKKCKELENKVWLLEQDNKKYKVKDAPQFDPFVVLCIIIFNAMYTIIVVMK